MEAPPPEPQAPPPEKVAAFSEEEACRLATEAEKAGEANGKYRNVQITGCKEFESDTANGTASIRLIGSREVDVFHNGRWQSFNYDSRTRFRKTDQGWKVPY